MALRGLSPRVRGNQGDRGLVVGAAGSIPARAGEPYSSPVSAIARWVYPRACGGTCRDSPRASSSMGLSPRVRGNRRADGQLYPVAGSIPARAGEPYTAFPSSSFVRVYPRACGGTRIGSTDGGTRKGLSPRVRGNPAPSTSHTTLPWSIPARAGEPPACTASVVVGRVYPRACGGTAPQSAMLFLCSGLSPRVRGNLLVLAGLVVPGGSIPARAGEPHFHRSNSHKTRVYPRACGGTSQWVPHISKGRGLSPRVRGNHE